MSINKVDGSVVIEVDASLSKLKGKLSELTKIGIKSLAGLTAVAGATVVAVSKVGIEYESAFAGVRKTVNATEEEFKHLSDEILKMSTRAPQTAAGLASIMESAGQLGIQKENLVSFTKTMADLGEATNLTGEAAATTLARFANITQMDQKNFDRLGSTIVDLGNNLATTEAEITDMALAIAGAGKQVGLTEHQILAISGALSSVGVEAQAGGTAISTFLIKMKKASLEGVDAMQAYANAAGLSAREFKSLFDKDTAQAFNAIIQGLSTAGQRGKNALNLLDEMGVKEVRMTRAFTSLAGASSVLDNAFKIGANAWKENIALTKEAAQRYQTTESKLKILQNGLTRAGITAFEKFKQPFKEALDTGIDSLNELNSSLEGGEIGRDLDVIAKGFAQIGSALIGGIAKGAPHLIKLVSFLASHGSAVLGVGTGVAVFKTVKSVEKLITASKKAHLAVKLLSTSLSPTGMAFAVAGVVAVTAAMVTHTIATDKAYQAHKRNNKILEETSKRMASVRKEAEERYEVESRGTRKLELLGKQLDKMIDAEGQLIGSKDEVIKKVAELNEAYGSSEYYYDEQRNTIISSDGVVKSFTNSLKELIATQQGQAWISANQEAYTQALRDQHTLVEQQIERQRELNSLLADNPGLKEAVEQSNALKTSLDSGKISMDEYTKASADLYAKYGEVLSRSLSEYKLLTDDIKANENQLKESSDIVKTFEDMQKAINEVDVDKISAITAGVTNKDLDLSGNGIIELLEKLQEAQDKLEIGESLSFFPEEEKERLNSEIEALKSSITEITAMSFDETPLKDAGAQAIQSFLEGFKDVNGEYTEGASVEMINTLKGLLTPELEIAGQETGNTLATSMGNELNAQLPDKGLTATDLMVNAMTAKLQTVTLPPIYVDIKPRVSGEFDAYGANVGGASYDGDIGGSFISSAGSQLVNMSKSVVRGIQDRIGGRISGSTQQSAVTGSSLTTIKVDQTNNFNVKADKPSDIARKQEEAVKRLAKEI